MLVTLTLPVSLGLRWLIVRQFTYPLKFSQWPIQQELTIASLVLPQQKIPIHTGEVLDRFFKLPKYADN